MEERLRSLFEKYIANTCTPEELEEMFSIINTGLHENFLRSMVAEVYETTGTTVHTAPVIDAHGRLSVNVEPVRIVPISARIARHWKAAAAVLLLIGATAFWLMRSTAEPDHREADRKQFTVAATTDDRKYLLLPDSTQVWLNAGSELQYPPTFDNNARIVQLTGEAFFDVQHADKVPFLIRTGNVTTKVLGTAFNVKAYPGQSRITISVSRGKVEVSRGEQLVATLMKGQEVRVAQRESEVEKQDIASAAVGAWQQGSIMYSDERLTDILMDLERVYGCTVTLAEQLDPNVRISTSFNKDIGVQQALLILCQLTDTRLEKNGNTFFIQ